ncbi:MAG: hypothetical protein HY908_32245 [Myxococcales bacterium]|nr:hypothetical protein [Myxococcales bacterium]
MKLVHLVLVATAAGSLFGCGEESSDPNVVVESATALSTIIGADGGVLEGDPGGNFAGVRLDIPAGALATDTEISISLPTAPQPFLPGSAEGVGPTFVIEPAGLALAASATLTLPVSADERERFLVEAGDCKVWQRNGDGWSRLENIAATDTTVTVATSVLDTAAAGVLVVPKLIKGACDGVPNTNCMLLSCNTPGQFCLEDLDAVPGSTQVVSGKHLFYREPVTGQNGFAVRFDLDTKVKQRVAYTALDPCPQITNGNAPFMGSASDLAGNLWGATCKIDFSALTRESFVFPFLFLSGAPTSSLSRVRTTDGNLQTVQLFGSGSTPPNTMRLTRLDVQTKAVDDGPVTLLAEMTRLNGNGGRAVADPASPTGVWALVGIAETAGDKTHALVHIDGNRVVDQLIKDTPQGRVVGGGNPAVLSIQGDEVLTASFPPGVSATAPAGKLNRGSLSAGNLYVQTLALPDEVDPNGAVPRVRAAVLDADHGIWAIKTESGFPDRLLYYPVGATKPFMLKSDGIILGVDLATAGRTVVLTLPTNSSAYEIFTLRKVP